MSTTTNQRKSKQIDDESNTGSARSSSACFLSHPQKCKTLFRILKEMKPHFKHMKRRDWPSNDELHHDSVRDHDPQNLLQHAVFDTETEKTIESFFFLNPNWASAFGADWLLTCSRRPGWCLHASVCHPERCPSSPCCWPAEAASCRLSAASLQETPSPWQERTDKL